MLLLAFERAVISAASCAITRYLLMSLFRFFAARFSICVFLIFCHARAQPSMPHALHFLADIELAAFRFAFAFFFA